MSDIIIETKNKKKMSVSKNQLFELAANGQISPDTKLWYKGKETTCKKIQGIRFQVNEIPSLNSQAYQTPSQPVFPQNRPENTSGAQNKKILIAGIVGMSVLIIILIAVVIFLVWNPSNPAGMPSNGSIPAVAQKEIPIASPQKEIKIPESTPVSDQKPIQKSKSNDLPDSNPTSDLNPFSDSDPVSFDQSDKNRSQGSDLKVPIKDSSKTSQESSRSDSSKKKSPEKTVALKPSSSNSRKNHNTPPEKKEQKKMDDVTPDDIPEEMAHIPFNEEIESLPPNFQAMEIDDIYHAILKMDFKKESLETKSEYQDRMKQKMQNKFLGELTLLSTFAVRYEDNMGYNADKELVYLTIPQITRYTPDIGIKTNRFNMQIKISHEDKGIYTAQNRFGAKVDVEESLLESFSLIMPAFRMDRPRIDVSSLREEIRRFPMKMPRDKAQEASGAISCLVIFKLAPVLREDMDNPYITFDIFRKKPKFDSPSDIKMRNLGLLAKDISLWYYNKHTGEIYYRFTLKEIAKKITR